MSSTFQRPLALALITVLCFSLVACVDEPTTAPPPGLQIPRPEFNYTQMFVMGTEGSFNIPSPQNNSFLTGAGAAAEMSTGLTIPAGISYAKITVTSSLKPITSAIYRRYYSAPHQEAYLEGVIVPPAGAASTHLALTFRVGGEYFPVPTTAQGAGQWSASMALNRTTSGSLTVQRGPWAGASTDCPRNPDGTNPCAPGDAYWWEFTGSQTMQLSFFGVEARSATYIARGEQTTATLGILGDGALDYVEEWFWVQDNGWWTYIASCRYRTSCSYTPTQNGHWEVQAKVNGVFGVRGRGPNLAVRADDLRLSRIRSR